MCMCISCVFSYVLLGGGRTALYNVGVEGSKTCVYYLSNSSLNLQNHVCVGVKHLHWEKEYF